MSTILSYDVCVIGGGPAGMAAAIESANNGATTLLLEGTNKLGGILNQCIHNGFGLHYFKKELTGPEYALRFCKLLKKSNVEVKLNSYATTIESNKVVFINKDGEFVVKCKSVVLAMGCREKTASQITLTGTRPVGVYTAGQAQKMVNIYGKLPGKKIVILGSGDIGLIMARRLQCEGAAVLEVLEIKNQSGGLARNIVQCLHDYNIPLKTNHTVTEVVGDERLKGVYVSQTNNFKIVPNTSRFIECDCLILSVGLAPEVDHIKGLEINPKTGGAIVNEYRETNLKNVFSCGNVLHVHDLVDNVTQESILAGKYASANALSKLNYKNSITLSAGDGISYVSPSTAFICNNDELTMYFRVLDRVDKKYVCVECDGKVVYSKFNMVIHGADMQKIVINKGLLTKNATVSIRSQI